MTQPKPFTCLLCSNAGRPTLAPRAKLRWLICEDCNEGLGPLRRWCNVGRHIVPARDWYGKLCRACNTRRVLARRAKETPEQRARRFARQQAYGKCDAQRAYRAAYMQRYRVKQKLRFFWRAA
jgi:hypothetical protein